MNLQARVMNILTKPQTEWPVIAMEPSDVASLYKNYILILAAIPAVAGTLGWMLIGGFFGPVGLTFAIMSGIMGYCVSLASAFIAAFIIEKLAPTFDSHGDTAQALKLVAYASTPVWVAGILRIVPLLGVLILLAALYAVYLFYLGLAPVMKTPGDKVVPYMIVSAIVVVVVYFVLAAITGAILGSAVLMGGMAGRGMF